MRDDSRFIPVQSLPVLGEPELTWIAPTSVVGRVPIDAIPALFHEAIKDTDSANMLMRLFYILSALGQDEQAAEMQAKALQHRCLYRICDPSQPAIRLLMMAGEGGMAENMPVDFLVENSDIRLDILYITEDSILPEMIPEHDVLIVALGESEKNLPVLQRMASLLTCWPRPYLNHPDAIRQCARHTAAELLQTIDGLLFPKTIRLRADEITSFAVPFILRPIDTHAGKGLVRIDHAEQLTSCLLAYDDHQEFYLADFIDYQSEDGYYRKYRIALIDQQPYICHLAIGDDWIVHYKTAHMEASAQKRAEEQSVMEQFEEEFAQRHHAALHAIAGRFRLDYLVMDCAETRDGRLVVFEVDSGAWVHATDSPILFPYKAPIMQKAFDAFRDLLVKRAALFVQKPITVMNHDGNGLSDVCYRGFIAGDY